LYITITSPLTILVVGSPDSYRDHHCPNTKTTLTSGLFLFTKIKQELIV
jgi:hypothetical protein